MSSYKIVPLPNSQTLLGEGPHWDINSQSLYFVDIDNGKLLRYDYKQNKTYHSQIEGQKLASFIIPVEGKPNEFAVGVARRVVIVNWDGISETCKITRTLFEVQNDARFVNNRFNDGKCDPRGRLYAGTMNYVGGLLDKRTGELYKYDKGSVEVVKSDVGISNGLAWNEKAKKFYYSDTADFEIKEYDYDVETGVVGNPKVILNLRKTSVADHILPDGMTIDADGNLYLATYNGSCVIKFDPTTGNILSKIQMPCKQITSAAFGGPNLDILFVTTSSVNKEPEPAGTTYMITGLGTRGLPMTNLRI